MNEATAMRRTMAYGKAIPTAWRLTGIAGMTLMAAACGITKPKPQPVLTAVPDERIISRTWLNPGDGLGELHIVRDKKSTNPACDTRVSVNWVPTADLQPGEELKLYLPVTTQQLINVAPMGSCAGGMQMVDVQLTTKKPVDVHIDYAAGHALKLHTQMQGHFRTSY